MREENRKKESIVYVAINQSNKKKYVGATSRSLKERISSHKSIAKNENNKGHFQRAIRKYGIASFCFYTLSKWDNYKDALNEEVRVIALIKPEYNMSSGGEGVIMPRTPEWSKNISIANKGRKPTQEALINMRAARRVDQSYKKIICLNDGNVFNAIKSAAEFYKILKHRISTVLKEKEISVNGLCFSYFSEGLLIEENRKKILEERLNRKKFAKFNSSSVLSKPVICVNDGIVYCSALEASRHYNISDGSIRNSCAGKTKSKIGLHFKYLENENDSIERAIYVQKSNNSKKIICVNGGKIFESIYDASRFYGVSDGNIGSVLKGRRSHTGGKTFKYAENI
jgi:group I intron endonuclease